MKDLSRLAVACAACAAGASGASPGASPGPGPGRRPRRRLHASALAERLTHTEIFGASLPVLRPRGEDPDGAAAAAGAAVPCASPSAEWLRGLVRDASAEDEADFFDWYLHALPFAYKLYVAPIAGRGEPGPGGDGGRREDEEYFGLDGEYTDEIRAANERARAFWSGSGVDDDIRVLSAHGHDLADRHDKLVPTLELLFGESYVNNNTAFRSAADHAAAIQELILRLPGGYDFPLLTFNAFATYESDKHDAPSIIIGDGYFAYQRAAGLGSEGPEYALAHEHAHHLQFALGARDDEGGGDEGGGDDDDDDRRKELMADALAAYFLAHDGGGDLTGEELANVHDVAYSVGDCEVGDDGHHGTPRERRCATVWGASVGDSRDFPTLGLLELEERFDEWYGRVDELDGACGHASSSYPMPMAMSRGLLVVAVPLGCAFAAIVAFLLFRRRTSRGKVLVDDAPKVFRTNSSMEGQPRTAPSQSLKRRTSLRCKFGLERSVSDENDDKVFQTNSSKNIHKEQPQTARQTSLRCKLGLERSGSGINDDPPRVFRTDSTLNIHEEQPLTTGGTSARSKRGLERSVSDVVHSTPGVRRTDSSTNARGEPPRTARRSSMMSKLGLERSGANIVENACRVFQTNSSIDIHEEQPLTDVEHP